MLGAIYIGLSGMTAYSQGLQTISNNVANLNVAGFKTTSLRFSDVYSQGRSSLGYSGSIADQQYGSGVRYAPPSINFSQGDLRQTGNDLDLAIQGGGFLTLLDGKKRLYTRTGQFGLDKDGYVIEQGSTKQLAVLDSARNLVPVTVDGKRTNPPQATKTIKFADNLSSTATDASVTGIKVFDASGGEHDWSVSFTPQGATAPGIWDVKVQDENGTTIQSFALKFVGSTPDPSADKFDVSFTPSGGTAMTVSLDFSSGVTSYSSGTSSTLRAASTDGYAAGALTAVTVDDEGELKLAYSNGQSEVLGHVAIADFDDPQQLEQLSGGLFEYKGLDAPRYLQSDESGVGKLESKQLEASNVDLSKEFGDLILVQRGFQASSQVVSVANDMIQQLFGIKGQG